MKRGQYHDDLTFAIIIENDFWEKNPTLALVP